MYTIDQIYINGQFVTPHGDEMFDLFNPTNGQLAGQVRLGDADDTRRAGDAAIALVEQYGGPLNTSMSRSRYTANMFLDVKQVMDDHVFEKTVNKSKVKLEPVGVVGIITPWNSSA